MGTDLVINFGVNYDALRDNWGVTFEIPPILLPARNVKDGGLIGGSGRDMTP